MLQWRRTFTPIQIHVKLAAQRARRNIPSPDVIAVRNFLKGKTQRRSAVETRGAKTKWTRAHVMVALRGWTAATGATSYKTSAGEATR